jgi:xanthine/uracil permease
MLHELLSILMDVGLDFIHIAIFLVGVAGFAFLLGCFFSSISSIKYGDDDPDQSNVAGLFGGCVIGVVVGFIINLVLSINLSVGSAFLAMLGLCICLLVLSLTIWGVGSHLRNKRAARSNARSNQAD